jgi:hypothetical protein
MFRFSRTSFIGRVLYAATASVLSVVAVAIASASGDSHPAPQAGLYVSQVSGSVTGGDSPAATVLEVTDLAPGESSYGTVTVVNRGRAGGLLTLSAPAVSDAPGRGGGALSARLQVTVLDVTAPGPELVYSGGASGMQARSLGYIRPGEARSYLVGASFIPGDGPASAMGGDDQYAGGSTRLALDWGAVTASSQRPARAAADDRAPKVSIEVPGRQDVLGQGHLNVRVLCDEPCHADATLAAAGVEGVLARATDRSAAGSADLTLDLPVTLQDSLRQQLAAGETVVFEASATARDEAGNKASATRRVGLTPTP